MSRRLLALIGAAVVMVIVALVALPRLRPGPAADGKGPAPGTAWGEPDLQGIWTADGEIPLQRPAKYANREFFTDEERAELDKQRATAIGREADESRRQRGSEQDVGGAYNAAIFTTHKPLGRRTVGFLVLRSNLRRRGAPCQVSSCAYSNPQPCAKTSCPAAKVDNMGLH